MIDLELVMMINGPKYGAAKDEVMRQFRRSYCQYVLAQAGGTIAAAAKLAGTDRSRFKQMMRSVGVKASQVSRDAVQQSDASSSAGQGAGLDNGTHTKRAEGTPE